MVQHPKRWHSSGMAEIKEKANITKLNDSNYQLWKFKMQMIFRGDGVCDNAYLPKPAADKQPTDWNQWERKAVAVIDLPVKYSQLYTFLH
jgi:hypothetical protein